MSAKLIKSGPGLGKLSEDLRRLKSAQVLVGIPESNAPREDGEMNNAGLMALHSKGSPLQGIPARPVLQPSIKQNRETIAEPLQKAAHAVLTQQPDEAIAQLNKAGIAAANGAKRYFTEGHLAPNAPSTIAQKGSDTPLVDTAAMRRAITYVVNFNDSDKTTAVESPQLPASRP